MGKGGGGGSAPQKPKMSAAEKTQYAVSAAEWDRYKTAYAPLEEQYLSDAQRNFENRGRAQASSSVMREGTEAMRLSALGGGVTGAASAVGNAAMQSRVAATSGAQQERDARMAGALGIGREIATDTNRSLSSLANTGAQGAINEMQNKLKVDSARSAARAQMVGSVVGAGAAVYMGRGGGGGTGEYWSRKGGRTTAQVEPTSIF